MEEDCVGYLEQHVSWLHILSKDETAPRYMKPSTYLARYERWRLLARVVTPAPRTRPARLPWCGESAEKMATWSFETAAGFL